MQSATQYVQLAIFVLSVYFIEPLTFEKYGTLRGKFKKIFVNAN